MKRRVYIYTESASESGDLAMAVFYFQRERELAGDVAMNSVQFEMESWTGAQNASP